MTTWTAAGISIDACRSAVALVSKERGWFKRVDKGSRLGTFILETASLRSGPVMATIDELKAAIYARPVATRAATPRAGEGDQTQAESQIEQHVQAPTKANADPQPHVQHPEPPRKPSAAPGAAGA
jgi:hypothetical protein